MTKPNKNIEVEIRGPLTKVDFLRLEKFLKKNGHFVQKKDRILIDYSSENIESRENDIRLRVTNKIPEIVVKTGKLGGSDERQELSVLTKKDNFDNLVKIFAALGHKKGILCVRKGNIYEYKDIEFSVVEVPGHSFYFEVEKLIGNDENKESAKSDLIKMCKQLKLKVFTDKALFSYLRKLNSEANEIFNFENYKDNYFKQRFNL